MNRISGQIVREEDRRGIDGAIVVLYDLDITRINGNTDTIRPAGSLATQYLQLIYGLPDAEEDPVLRTGQPAGDRLGSVITDGQGRFSLSYEDLAFQVGDQEQRPDLILLVIAPDRSSAVYDENNVVISFGTPEYQRILHMTLFPTRNAGREEQLIIRIPEKTLQQFDVDLDENVSRSYLSAVSGTEARQRNVQRSFSKQLDLSGKVQKQRSIEKSADTFTANLSAIPRSLRIQPLFIGPDDDVNEAHSLAREIGTARLSLHSDISLTAAHLRLSEEDLDRLGILSDPDNGIGDLNDFAARLRDAGVLLQLNPRRFCAMLQDKIGGTTLEALTRLLDEKRQEAHARSTALGQPPEDDGGDDGSDDGGSDDGGGEDSGEVSPETWFRQIVMAQVAAMVDRPDDTPDEDGQREQIFRAFNDLRPPASPADVTAFHDFNHLQVAFPDVWAEAFDRDVRDIVRTLHIEYRNYDEDFQVDDETLLGIADLDPNELQDLSDYTDLLRKLGADVAAIDGAGAPPPAVVKFFALADNPFIYDQQDTVEINEVWGRLSVAQQQELYELATQPEPALTPTRHLSLDAKFEERVQTLLDKDDPQKIEAGIKLLREIRMPPEDVPEAGLSRSERVNRARFIVANPEGRITHVQKLLAGLAERLSEPHSFRVFQKNSINFGIVTTYRQEWQPDVYQVGNLVGTLPLAPGETRKYTKKETHKKTRAQKENERYASTLHDERTLTSRAIADIIQKAGTTTNFNQTIQTNASGKILGFDVGLNTSSQFQRNQTVESERVKKQFNEAVRKSSQEYKDERSLEISTEVIGQLDAENLSEISNPNNEITVTYLFYELERQYRVSEHLHRLAPVVLVAQEIPNPADIDADWLLAHEWILRRSLLDASFHAALDVVAEGLVQDEITLEIAREHFETQRILVEELSASVDSLNTLQDTLRNTLVQTAQQEKLARVTRKQRKKRRRRRFLGALFAPVPDPTIQTGLLASGTASLAFGNSDESPEVLEARREALETRLEFLEGTLEDARSRLTRATSVLEKATAELSAATQDSFARRTMVSQLRIHIKDNILHYMQAIWQFEKPDQRFFRLYDLPVEIPIPGDAPEAAAEYAFTPRSDVELNGLYPRWVLDTLGDRLPVRVTMAAPTTSTEIRRLHEIADLDTLIGFKGNYMIFPMKECTYITDFMMQDYIDDYFGIRDPDPVADYATDELLTYAEQVWHAEDTTDETREALRALVQQRLTSARLDAERIVVPTGQLFIEALKGEHALLEHFKAQHRKLDVQKVQEDIRAQQLENLRRAARLLQDTPLLDDPDVDTKVIIEGDVDPDIEV